MVKHSRLVTEQIIKKVRTGLLYQIAAYVNSSDFLGNINGILPYPTINQEINCRLFNNRKKHLYKNCKP